jgi:hypothetical protein
MYQAGNLGVRSQPKAGQQAAWCMTMPQKSSSFLHGLLSVKCQWSHVWLCAPNVNIGFMM